VKVFTSATVYEFVKEVAYMLDTAPQFMSLSLPNGNAIEEKDYGKTIAQLGLKNNDILNARSINCDKDLGPEAALYVNGALTEAAAKAFNHMFDLYANEAGVMTTQGCVHFIRGATGEIITGEDSRIKTIMGNGKDGILTRDGFVGFFTKASSGAKTTAVFNNLEQHNIRRDLIRMRDVR
jgi:hypothetical protein